MARDNLDKQTRSLPLTRRGRPAKLASGAMSAAERKAAERARRRARGEVQMWLTPQEVAAVEAMRGEIVELLERWEMAAEITLQAAERYRRSDDDEAVECAAKRDYATWRKERDEVANKVCAYIAAVEAKKESE